MHVSISLIVQVVRWVLCTLVVYAALFLHEDEPDCLRGLRLDNKVQQPHSPPARWTMDASSVELWREETMACLLEHGLGRF
jgi:hypothetical protein